MAIAVHSRADYDPFAGESPDQVATNWTLQGGSDFIDDVSGGFATTSMGIGDGWWQYDNAGLDQAVGWTLDARVRVGLANPSGGQPVGVVMRQPGAGQLELRIEIDQFSLLGEGAGVIGAAQAFAFDDGAFHTLRVSRLGSNVRVYVDDNPVPFVDATFTQTQDFGGNRVSFGRIGSDYAGLAVLDAVRWDSTQAVFAAPGNAPGNNQPRIPAGQPAFQLGWYVSAFLSGSTYTTDLLDELAAHGFNTVRHADIGEGLLGRLIPQDAGSTPAAAMAFLDAAAARGVGVEVYLRKHFADDTPAEHENLRGVVNGAKDHAALSHWHIAEEPADPGGPAEMPLANFRALAANVAALDLDTPLSAVFSGDGSATYSNFLPFVDVAAADYYPVRDTPGWDTPAKMRASVARARDLVLALGTNDAATVWVGQAFDTPGFVLPTADQQRYLTWAPIVEGIRGAMYFAFQHMSPAERQARIYAVTDELVDLLPAITSATPAPAVTSNRDSSTPGDGIEDVTYLVRAFDGFVYVVASGNRASGQTAQFTVHRGFSAGTTVEVIGEGRVIVPAAIHPGSLVFDDTFGALSVHLYRIPVPSYDTWAVSFGLTGTNAAFEADSDGDGSANGCEWATGTIPTNEFSFTPLDIARTGQVPVIRFTRNPEATDAVLRLQRADGPGSPGAWSNFVSWLAGGWVPSNSVTESGPGNPVDVEVSEDPSPGSVSRFRLEVSRP